MYNLVMKSTCLCDVITIRMSLNNTLLLISTTNQVQPAVHVCPFKPDVTIFKGILEQTFTILCV